jgi:hypothetical protein
MGALSVGRLVTGRVGDGCLSRPDRLGWRHEAAGSWCRGLGRFRVGIGQQAELFGKALRNTSAPLVADELRKLAELWNSGALTEAVFVKQKNRLLG